MMYVGSHRILTCVGIEEQQNHECMCVLSMIRIWCWNSLPMDDITAWLPEMLLSLNTIESPDITVSPAVQNDIVLEIHMYAPTTNEMDPP